MKSYLATYYFQDPVGEEATVLVFDNEIHIGYSDRQKSYEMLKWKIAETNAVFDRSFQSTHIRNPVSAGLEFYIKGNEAFEYLELIRKEQQKPWYKKGKAKGWAKSLLIFLGVVSVLTALYFLLVPWMSEKLADQVSVETEEHFGEAIYNAMNLGANEDTALSSGVQHFFEKMEVSTPYAIKISVISDETVNAFALPGGSIIIYTALLKKIKNYPELAALLSHEVIHINNRHSTKSIFRKLGSSVFIGLLLGKMGSVTSVLVDHADDLKSLTYSRRLEKEADLDGLAILKKRGIDSKGFIDLFRHLSEVETRSYIPEFLTSHPDIEARIKYVQEASGSYRTIENSALKSIFEKIKMVEK